MFWAWDYCTVWYAWVGACENKLRHVQGFHASLSLGFLRAGARARGVAVGGDVGGVYGGGLGACLTVVIVDLTL